MQRTKESLTELLAQRLRTGGVRAQQYVDAASEVIVFGSVSAGLDRPNSDIDVLCIGPYDCKLKTDVLDLIGFSRGATEDRTWLQSELVSHVAAYGSWIRGSAAWANHVRIGERVVVDKHRRVSAFIRSLSNSWVSLDGCFRKKYAIKLRRETQRLILLEQGIPVPPTRVLDNNWSSFAKSPLDICERLEIIAGNVKTGFMDELVSRVRAHFETN
jgi:predicted nucleotidyltransferase